MEKKASLWPWGAPAAARDLVCEAPVFRCKGAAFSRERSYDRTVLRFTAPGERAIPDAMLELSYINAVLLDERGHIVTRRSHDSGRQTLLGPQLTWAHEFYDDQLARASSVVYEVEARVDVRRTLYTGKLGAVDFDADTRQAWPLASGEPAAADRLVQLSFSTFYNRGEFEIFAMAATACTNDGHRTELEVALLDEAGAVVGSRWLNLSINSAGVGYNDGSIRLEKRIARQIAALELRGRTEVRSVNRIGPILLDDSDKKSN
jgi:hypothetical protein